MSIESAKPNERPDPPLPGAHGSAAVQMRNPHIIVGEGRRCLCGTYVVMPYGATAITCGRIISVLSMLNHYPTIDEAQILIAALGSLMVDCDEPPNAPHERRGANDERQKHD